MYRTANGHDPGTGIKNFLPCSLCQNRPRWRDSCRGCGGFGFIEDLTRVTVFDSAEPEKEPSPAAKTPVQPTETTSLRLTSKPALLSTLLQEHQLLLTKIEQKRGLFDHLTSKIMEADNKVRPLMAEVSQLDRKIHDVFAALLSRQGQSRYTQSLIRNLYEKLKDAGVLSQSSFDISSSPNIPPPTARQPQGPAERQALRGLFLRLAAAIHPDKTNDQAKKARRTEAMKEITRAYHAGDLARLLDIEQAWITSGEMPTNEDELSYRCEALRQKNTALREQLAQLTKDLHELQNSPNAQDLQHRNGTAQIDIALKEADHHLCRLRQVIKSVCSYRDGEIGIGELEFRLDGGAGLGFDEEFDL